ncbi:hypothetical protein Acsp05_34460 [Actinokineospora sp. NBRC 105648]|nr:hypothetical protein Acsp05_34460 [Actinokineospora sp. NBRC 105648]
MLGLVLGACASGPSQVNAAVVIGDKTITVDQVQDLVAKAVQVEPAAKVLAEQRKLDLLSREILRRLIEHELITHYAAKNGISIDPGQVSAGAKELNETYKQLPTDGSVEPTAVVKQAAQRALDPELVAHDILLMTKVGAQQAPTLQVGYDFTFIAPDPQNPQTGSLRAEALAKAKQLAESPAEARRIIDADLAGGKQAAKDKTAVAQASQADAGSVLFGAPAGSVVTFQADPQSGAWVVVVIRTRDLNGKLPANAPQLTPELAAAVGERVLEPVVAELGVKISPRYGVWDEVAMAIAPSADQVTGAVLPFKNATAP